MVFIVEMVSVAGDPDPGLRAQFRCHYEVWEGLQELGRRFGWNPLGPVDNTSGQPVGDYEPTEWGVEKRVVAEDAAKWADALERAFVEVPTRAESPRPPLFGDTMALDDIIAANEGISQALVGEFIRFMRHGPFYFAWDD